MKIKIYSVIAAVLSGIAVGGKFLSDYGCDLECNQGDVVYEIEAVVDRIRIPGNFSEFYCEECHEQRPFKGVSEVYANVRTFRATNNTKQSKFCEMMDGYDGVKGITGPCLQVLPGQTMSIKLINNMHDAMEELDTHIPSRKEWWESAGRPKPLKKMHPEKETTENIPGWAFDGTVFDTTNLHFHGLKIVPHLFYPLGTNEPTAPWISK